MAEYGEKDFNPNIGSSRDKKNKQTSFFNFELSLFNTSNPRRIKVPLKAKLIFFRQLSVILQSGVPLSQGLDLLSDNVTNKKFAECIHQISKDLGSGIDLSFAFRNYPKIFDPIIVGLIGGILLFPSPDFSKSILVGIILPLDFLPIFVSQSLLFCSFIVATFLPILTWRLK